MTFRNESSARSINRAMPTCCSSWRTAYESAQFPDLRVQSGCRWPVEIATVWWTAMNKAGKTKPGPDFRLRPER